MIIDPRPGPDDALTSTAVDLRLAETGLEWEALTGGFQIRPGDENYKYSKALKHQKQVQMTGYKLAPRSFVLGWTKEIIQLPTKSRLAARVEGRSSLARLGIGIHITAPTIHAGFGDPVPQPIQLEICNFGPHDIILDAGMRICQLIVEQTLGTPIKGYEGQFQKQAGA